MPTPEEKASEKSDQALERAGWQVQDTKSADLTIGRGVALRNFPLTRGHGFADYLLYIDGRAAGVIEAKKEGVTLTGVEVQSTKCGEGLSPALLLYTCVYLAPPLPLSKHRGRNPVYERPRP